MGLKKKGVTSLLKRWNELAQYKKMDKPPKKIKRFGQHLKKVARFEQPPKKVERFDHPPKKVEMFYHPPKRWKGLTHVINKWNCLNNLLKGRQVDQALKKVERLTDETRPRGRRFHTVSCKK